MLGVLLPPAGCPDVRALLFNSYQPNPTGFIVLRPHELNPTCNECLQVRLFVRRIRKYGSFQ